MFFATPYSFSYFQVFPWLPFHFSPFGFAVQKSRILLFRFLLDPLFPWMPFLCFAGIVVVASLVFLPL